MTSKKKLSFSNDPFGAAAFEPFDIHNDPLLPSFWHLLNAGGSTKGANVTNVWDEFLGTGIVIGVIDDGVDYTHPDLTPNYDIAHDLDTRDGDADAAPTDPNDRHGTTVAGVIGADIDNAIGGAGVAPGATIVGYRIGFGANGTVQQIEDAYAQLASLDVANNSWGYSGFLGDDFNSPFFAATATHLENALDTGRGGLGIVVVFSAGNSRVPNGTDPGGQNVNYHSFQNHRGIITVAATDSAGNFAAFSTPGDAILVAAPGVGIQTTDRVGSAGYVSGDYVSISGTSFSAPIVSGVVALMLDANPNLGWRDVQEILASTAIQTGSAAGWSFNHADNWNGGAMHVSHDLGFGLVDAMAAVRVAESWHQPSTSANEMFVTNTVAPNAAIPDLGTLNSVLNLAGGIRIDHVEVDVSLLHPYIGNLRVTLTSPTGTQSVLFDAPPTDQDNIFFTFSTTHDWGELSGGAWTLGVSDLVAANTGTLLNWTIRAYGDPVGDDTYVYTDEFSSLAAADATRRTLTDTGGVDSINASALATATSLDLRPGNSSVIDGQSVTIAAGTMIENADTGDGNDTIIGNDAANWLRGWRGNDTIDGGLGADTMEGGAGDDSYVVENSLDVIVENLNEGTDAVQSSVTYTLSSNVENLTLTGSENINGTGNELDNILTGNDQYLSGTGNNMLVGGAGNDVLDGRTGADTLVGGTGDDTYILNDYSGGQTSLLLQSEPGEYIGQGQIYSFNTATGTFTPTLYDQNYDGQVDYVSFRYFETTSPSGNWFNLDFSTTKLGTNFLPGFYPNAEHASFTTPGHPGLHVYGNNRYPNGVFGNFTVTAATFDYSGQSPAIIDWSISFEQHSENPSGPALYGTLNYNHAAAGPGILDVIVENPGEGTDLIKSSFSYSLVDQPNIENLTLTGTNNTNGIGNDLGNVITGNSGNNSLDGSLGIDTIFGGAGNDIYALENPFDVIVESPNQGTDTVQSSVTYTLGSNVENLTLTGNGNIDGTGNGLDNLITSNAGSNVLAGGAGNDTYVVSSTGTLAIENPGEGSDLVKSSVTYTLSSNVENLTLTGSGNIDATGNASDNILTGNDQRLPGTGNNMLVGGAGNDTLDGRTGADTLVGGTGDDTYIINDYSGGQTSLLLQSEPGEWIGQGNTYTFNTNTGVFTPFLSDNNRDGQVDDVSFLYEGWSTYDRFGLYFQILQPGTNLAPGYYLDGVSVSGNGSGSNQVFGNFTVTTAIFDYSGPTPTIVDLSISFEQHSESPSAPALYGTLNYNHAAAGTATLDVFIENPGEGTDLIKSSFSYSLADQPNIENLTLIGNNNINGTGNDFDNVIAGNAGNNTLDGGPGADSMLGGAGNDSYIVENLLDVIVENANQGTDLVQSSVTYSLSANVENLTLTGSENIDGTGNGLDNTITSNSGDNVLTGGAGSDIYVVNSTETLVIENAGAGTDLVKSSVTYTLSSNVENLTLTENGNIDGTGNELNNILTGNDQRLPGNGNNMLIGGAGNDLLDGRTGADTLVGGTGDDTYIINDYSGGQTSLVLQSEQGDFIGGGRIYSFNTATGTFTPGLGDHNLDGKIDYVRFVYFDGPYFASGAYFTLEFSTIGLGTNFLPGFYSNAEKATFTTSGHPGLNVYGNGRGSNQVFGNFTVTAATFDYSGPSPTIVDLSVSFEQHSGSPSAPALYGTLNYNHATAGPAILDVIVENPDEGVDLVKSSLSYSLAGQPNIETLTLTGTSNINGTGNDLGNVITGNTGNNILDGGLGADTMLGGAGNDIYALENPLDVIVESPNQGTDTVQSSVTYTLGSNVENVTLTGSGNIDGTGNELDNVITGNTGINVLSGNAGNDTYVVDNAGDIVIEVAGAGTDLVQSSVTYTLTPDVENLALTGASAINGGGNALNNILFGNSGNNTLDGGAGADSLLGGAGNDIYLVDNALDLVIENAGEGNDLVGSSVTYSLAGTPAVENLILTGTAPINGGGNALNNILLGNSGNNTLDGGTGADTLLGGTGDDIYLVDNALDSVIENAGEGNDLVGSSITYSLAGTPEVENLILTGTAPINGGGNALNNILLGNSGNNTLDGGVGADALLGGAGDDIYLVDNALDAVIENAGEGNDLIGSSVTYSLAGTPEVENLILTGTAPINGSGNALNNILLGNSGNNTLDGGAGADTLLGGAGDDIYLVDNALDLVIENAGEGNDLVGSSITYSLAGTPEVENLALTGASAINGGGNALNNILLGNSGNNTLDGGVGADTLLGGAGDDIYLVDNALDAVIENAGEGNDLVGSSVTYSLAGTPEVENLILTGTAAINGSGNALNNILLGNSENNTLDGGAGADTLLGGAGDDTYVVDSSSDSVTENASEGTDTVLSSATYALSSNIENLTLTGAANINASGGSADDYLLGNTGNNILTGGAGDDLLNGGSGSGADSLIGDTGTDVLEGMDGNDILSDTAGNNLFNGGVGADNMSGGTGNELFIGGAGNDAVNTGSGADIIAFNRGDGQDSIDADAGADNTLSVGGGIRYADMRFTKTGNNLELDLGGAGDKITLVNWYLSAPTNKSVIDLQVIAEAMADFDAGSSDPLLNKKIADFDFTGLVDAFDAAGNAASWALTNALLSEHLSGSDTAALGGDLAYRYGLGGSLANVGFDPAVSILSSASFGTAAQTLQSPAVLDLGIKRLS